MGGVFVVGIEDKLEEEVELEERLEEELQEEVGLEEINIYEKMQNIINKSNSKFNYKTFTSNPNEEMNKRIYISSLPILIPNKNK